MTGDPVGLAEMMRWEIKFRPAALISTAVSLNPGLQAGLGEYYHCPVIDWYSVTETGPVAYACPHGRGLHVLPGDIYVEAVDEEGFPVAEGESGELAVTGGRNPFLPLLRYRTGDWGRIDNSRCSCGDPHPRILDLKGRAVVLFRAVDGSFVNQADIGRVMRDFDFVQHEFIQRADGSCEVNLSPMPGQYLDVDGIHKRLSALFGQGTGDKGARGPRPDRTDHGRQGSALPDLNWWTTPERRTARSVPLVLGPTKKTLADRRAGQGLGRG